jgi:hypothetical protein
MLRLASSISVGWAQSDVLITVCSSTASNTPNREREHRKREEKNRIGADYQRRGQ